MNNVPKYIDQDQVGFYLGDARTNLNADHIALYVNADWYIYDAYHNIWYVSLYYIHFHFCYLFYVCMLYLL